MTASGGSAPFGHGSSRTADRRGFLRVVSWSYVAEAGGQVTTVLVGVVLASLVGPQAYGIVVMATAYILLVELLQRQGISSAVIQRSELTDDHASTAFWWVLGSSAALTAVSVAVADWWARLNGTPMLAPVIIALSAVLPLRALTIVQEALLRRRLDFKRVALRTSVASAVGGAVGLGVAIVEPTVWALVAQQLSTAIVAVVLLWSVTRWRPRFRVRAAATRDILGFSAGSFLSSLGSYLYSRADALLIGLLFGPVAVGIYALCVRMTEAFVGLTLRPVQAMALPELSPFQNEASGFRARLMRLDNLVAMTGLPLLGVLLASGGPLIALLGDEWSEATVPFQLLCAVAGVRVISGLNGPVLQALGRVYLHAAITWVVAVVGAAVVVLAGLLLAESTLSEQVGGLAVARVAYFVGFVLLVHVALLRTLLKLPAIGVVARYVAPLGAGTLGAVAGVALDLGLTMSWPVLGRLVVVVAVAAGVAFVALVLLSPLARAAVVHVLRCRHPATGRHRAQAQRRTLLHRRKDHTVASIVVDAPIRSIR